MRHNLNKFSKNLTQKKQNASAQAMLYGLGLTKKDLENHKLVSELFGLKVIPVTPN